MINTYLVEFLDGSGNYEFVKVNAECIDDAMAIAESCYPGCKIMKVSRIVIVFNK